MILSRTNKKAEQQKKAAAERALAYVEADMTVGIGTGSTTAYFIEALAASGISIASTVASSVESASLLQQHNLPVDELNHQHQVDLYVDGADECTEMRYLVKGGGGALTREKIIATVAKKFICIADESKLVARLGQFPVAVEVLPMARSVVAKSLIKLGGEPIYRENFTTDNGNIILDVHHFEIMEPIALEEQMNNIPGVVCNGLFARCPADIILLGEKEYI